MKQILLQHLVMIGIPIFSWGLVILFDRVLPIGVLGLFLIISMGAYTGFAFWHAKKTPTKSLFRIYPMIGVMLFLISLIMTIK